MLDIRQRILLVVGVILGVFGIILGSYFLLSKQTVQQSGTEQNVIPGGTVQENVSPDVQEVLEEGSQPTAQPGVTTPAKQPETPEEVVVRQTARLFVERFGTYSTQNDNMHITDVLTLSTPVMQRWLESQRIGTTSTYQGVTTRVITSKVSAIDAGKATVHVGVQMDEETGNTRDTKYKTGRVELVKEGNTWKIDGLYWDKQP
ncbi:MAG TPA: hypothetical protein VEA18_01835 [Candidatus Kapabacteria bacterium]|nr:hypothetical protein [Candidatus Kapabacteria bacterium]